MTGRESGVSELDVLMLIFLTRPSSPGFVSTMRPIGHLLRFASSSTSKTTSPTSRLGRVWLHFCLSCRLSRNSFLHRYQNSLAILLDISSISAVNIVPYHYYRSGQPLLLTHVMSRPYIAATSRIE